MIIVFSLSSLLSWSSLSSRLSFSFWSLSSLSSVIHYHLHSRSQPQPPPLPSPPWSTPSWSSPLSLPPPPRSWSSWSSPHHQHQQVHHHHVHRHYHHYDNHHHPGHQVRDEKQQGLGMVSRRAIISRWKPWWWLYLYYVDKYFCLFLTKNSHFPSWIPFFGERACLSVCYVLSFWAERHWENPQMYSPVIWPDDPL